MGGFEVKKCVEQTEKCLIRYWKTIAVLKSVFDHKHI